MEKRKFSCLKGGVKGDGFIGRERQMDELMKLADEERPNNIAIYGLPHVGKTSLMLEWKSRIEQQANTTASGRKLLIIRLTVPTGIDGVCSESDFTRFMEALLYRFFSMMRSAIKREELLLTDRIKKCMERLERAIRKKQNNRKTLNEYLVKLLSDTIGCIGRQQVRTVLMLDEFEHAGQFWLEEDYIRLMKVLMDEKLDLFCVVAARPHIEYIVSDYTQKIMPFQPMRLDGFDDNDMEQYMKLLAEETGKGALSQMDADDLRDIVFVCGRNPYLLAVMASEMNHEPARKPIQFYAGKSNAFKTHFDDVISFMLYEEAREKKSFTHIVKCYFGTSDDYADIIENYVRLGYIELHPADSMYSYEDERYSYTDAATQKKYYFTTVCPAFINYLHTEKLEEIRDVRDLLTGLVHSIRDITKLELEKVYAGADWNIELLKRLKSVNLDKELCAQQLSDGTWEMTTEPNQERKNWILQHSSEMITVTMSSLRYAMTAVNANTNHTRVMPVLDPINIVDNGNIILKYTQIFAPYFGVLGPLNYNGNQLLAHLEKVREARNEISHFSRDGMDENKYEECRRRCIYLLRSIYTYLGERTRMSPQDFSDFYSASIS
ncbi:MAG: ATP-binding protein [bacterium]|nr:ATP-binding protein [bacterium]